MQPHALARAPYDGEKNARIRWSSDEWETLAQQIVELRRDHPELSLVQLAKDVLEKWPADRRRNLNSLSAMGPTVELVRKIDCTNWQDLMRLREAAAHYKNSTPTPIAASPPKPQAAVATPFKLADISTADLLAECQRRKLMPLNDTASPKAKIKLDTDELADRIIQGVVHGLGARATNLLVHATVLEASKDKPEITVSETIPEEKREIVPETPTTTNSLLEALSFKPTGTGYKPLLQESDPEFQLAMQELMGLAGRTPETPPPPPKPTKPVLVIVGCGPQQRAHTIEAFEEKFHLRLIDHPNVVDIDRATLVVAWTKSKLLNRQKIAETQSVAAKCGVRFLEFGGSLTNLAAQINKNYP